MGENEEGFGAHVIPILEERKGQLYLAGYLLKLEQINIGSSHDKKYAATIEIILGLESNISKPHEIRIPLTEEQYKKYEGFMDSNQRRFDGYFPAQKI